MERQASASLGPMLRYPVMETAQHTITGLRRKALILAQVEFPLTALFTLSDRSHSAVSVVS